MIKKKLLFETKFSFGKILFFLEKYVLFLKKRILEKFFFTSDT